MITLVEFERVRSADSGMNVSLVQEKLDKYNHSIIINSMHTSTHEYEYKLISNN